MDEIKKSTVEEGSIQDGKLRIPTTSLTIGSLIKMVISVTLSGLLLGFVGQEFLIFFDWGADAARWLLT